MTRVFEGDCDSKFGLMLRKSMLQEADLAQSVERKALNLVVVGSSPTVGDSFLFQSRAESN